MPNANPVDRRAQLLNVTLKPVAAQLRTTASVERRDAATRGALLRRIRGEFNDMPGLAVTVQQGVRLFGVREDVTSRILLELVRGEVLRVTADGRFTPRTIP